MTRLPAKRDARAGRRLATLLRRERALWAEGLCRVAGVDEVGVGCLAGPVVAAAVVFPPGVGLRGVDDSKRLAPAAREDLAAKIRAAASGFAVARVESVEIDRVNIYQAALEAMRRAVLALAECPEHVLVDGRCIPGIEIVQERVVGGDARCHAIAAASILAKTARDRMMLDYDAQFPGYAFAAHKGYATEQHRRAIRELGPCEIHRRSFTLHTQGKLRDWAALAEI